MGKLVFAVIIAICTLGSPLSTAFACDVPVFRYALEHWDADLLEIVIVHPPQGLTHDEHRALDQLNAYSLGEERTINLLVSSFTSETLADSPKAELFDAMQVDPQVATLFLFHPHRSDLPGLIWQSPLSIDHVNQLLYSDVRLQISDAICNGTTIVWMMLESGDDERDSVAWKTLQTSLTGLPETIDLPEGVLLDDTTDIADEGRRLDPDSLLLSSLPLQIRFSAIRMKPSDDEVLFKTLMTMDGAEQRDQPLVFPFFGQGRTLDPLVGNEISNGNLEAIAEYLCGACSCEVKVQNPGVDVPMLCPWYQVLFQQENTVDYTAFQKRTAPFVEPPLTMAKPNPSRRALYVLAGLAGIIAIGLLGWKRIGSSSSR